MIETYRAIELQRFAPSFRAASEIINLEWRAPGPGEIAVRNHWCGVNGIFDTQSARNAVAYIPITLPSLTGVEAIGVVEAVGAGVTGFAVGDAAAATRFRSGYREANIAPADQFIRVPDASRESLTIASTGVAALLVLEHGAQLSDGETVAVSAAAGGLGHLIVQLAKLRGCHVVAICGGPDKAEFLAQLGADRVIDYKAQDVAAVLAADYANAIDVAIDTVGGTIFDSFLAQLAPHGRLIVSGAASDMDGQPEIITGPRVSHQLYYKAASIRAFQNGRVTHLWPDARARLFALYAAGKLRIMFDAVPFNGLASAYDAVERLLSGQTSGKVVIALDPANNTGEN